MRLGLRHWARLAAVAAVSFGCSGPRPVVKTALTGTLPELEREIARAEKAGELEGKQLTELARAVAEREIAGAQGADGAAQVAVFRPCLGEVQTALDERAERGDEVGAVATLLLLEAGKRSSTDLVGRYHEADSPAFRALAARSTLSPKDAELRRRFFTDPDEGVRRAAFEAAIKAPVAGQLPDLIEAARLDPSGGNRARAAQAAGRIGSEAAVLGLVDLFTGGDEQAQLAVLDAWSASPAFGRGGEREIARALKGQGLVSVSAASLLLRSRDSRGEALSVLARAIAEGSDDERRSALMAAPLAESSIQTALVRAAKSPSPELTPLVLSRLSELPSHRAEARASLEKLATDKGDAGLEASYELARMGSAPALTRLTQELSSERSARRLRAAVTLASLGARKGLAPRLADQDPLIRATLACRLTGAR
jgi:HEAT repeat protein